MVRDRASQLLCEFTSNAINNIAWVTCIKPEQNDGLMFPTKLYIGVSNDEQ